MDLVVNEWLPEYFRPNASREEKLQLQTFLQRFIEREDKMVVKEPSPFIEKILRYANDYQTDYEIVTPIRNFIKLVLNDSLRCGRVSDDEIEELPESVEEKLSVGNYGSDKYLFEAATNIEAEKLIVTTDARLQAHFENEDWCIIKLLPDFLADY